VALVNALLMHKQDFVEFVELVFAGIWCQQCYVNYIVVIIDTAVLLLLVLLLLLLVVVIFVWVYLLLLGLHHVKAIY